MNDIERLEEAIARDPADLKSRMELGTLYERREQPERAVAQYLTVLDADPNNAEAHFRAGTQLFLHGHTQEAFPFLRSAVELEPDNGNYWKHMGLLLYADGHIEESHAAFEAAHQASPELEDVPVLIAKTRLEKGDPQGALALTQELEPLAGTYPDVLITRTNANVTLMDLDGAWEAAVQATRLFPDEPGTLSVAGNVALIRGDLRSSETYLDRAYQRDPQHYEALIGKGNLELHRSALTKAERWFRAALEIDPDRFEAYVGLSAICYGRDDAKGLGHWSEEGIKRQPMHADLRYYRGLCLLRKGRVQDARLSFLDALAANPIHYQSHFELGNLYHMHLGDDRNADGHLRKVTEIAPESKMAKVARQMLERLRE